jgi:uncharacterized membrane-anchored protein
MDQPVNEYPQRLSLHHEVHARPPIALWPEERVCSQTFLIQDPQQRQIQTGWIENVLSANARSNCLVNSASYKLIQVEDDPHRLLLRWELHGEFSTLTVFHQNAVSLNQDDWSESRTNVLSMLRSKLATLGHPLPHDGFKNRIAALDLIIRTGPLVSDAAVLSPLFSNNTLIGSTILGSQSAQVWTDFQLDSNGFVRVLVQHQGMGSRQAGRVAQRLIDIDTYRMMSMLALPHAKGLSQPLRDAEVELSKWANEVSNSQVLDSGDYETPHENLLNGLSCLASRVEDWISMHGLRFTASEAYADLVKRALTELKETAIIGVQTPSEFMERRFEPAMRTCRWTQRRLQELSDRVSRTTQILRTRIEFMTERQNQELLASMNRRAQLQLKLQQTVEGLSLVVLTYYSVGLIQHVTKGIKALGYEVSIEIVTSLAVPIIAAILIIGLRQARRRFLAQDNHP